MSILQEQAVRMIQDMSDDNVSFLIEIIQRLIQKETYEKNSKTADDESTAAFRRLNAARMEIHQYLPEGFDPDKELEEARAERYGGIS